MSFLPNPNVNCLFEVSASIAGHLDIWASLVETDRNRVVVCIECVFGILFWLLAQ